MPNAIEKATGQSPYWALRYSTKSYGSYCRAFSSKRKNQLTACLKAIMPHSAHWGLGYTRAIAWVCSVPGERDMLVLIKGIRNRFGHNLHGLSFDEIGIASECKKLEKFLSVQPAFLESARKCS